MSKEEFKERWNSENGGGITFDDIAECAKKWGLFNSPRTAPIFKVGNAVLVAAGCEKYFQDDDEEADQELTQPKDDAFSKFINLYPEG